MRCRKAQKLLSVSFERNLDEAGDRDLQAHLADCLDCQRFSAGLAEVDRILSRWTAPEPRPGFTHRLMARLPEVPQRWFWWREWQEALRPATAIAAVLALCFGAILALSMNGQGDLLVDSREESDEARYAEHFEPVPGDSLGALHLAFLEETEK